MVGLIWLVQIVHYPLFASVGNRESSNYERLHTRLITFVVGPPMLIEATTAMLLVFFRPPGVTAWSLWTGLALLGIIWISTALLQVPCHDALSRGFDPVVHHRLVRTNWLRTAAWSLRGALVLSITWSLFSRLETVTAVQGSTIMTRIEVGDRAPDFSAMTYDGNTVRLSDFSGKRALVLFFYPKDGTPMCTQEACAFRDSYVKFIEAGAEVIGVSSDTEESHRTFARQHKLSFLLVSDADGSLRKAFAVPKSMGLLPGRVTYVIDQDGIIRQIFSAQFASAEHVRQALNAVYKIKGEVAP
jgi:thioredoxin-dependent peroxiredoxin